jgi:iron(III) transport system permease protein
MLLAQPRQKRSLWGACESACGRLRSSGNPLVFVALVLFVSIIAFITAYPVALVFVKSFVVSRPGQAEIWGLQGWIEAFNDATLLSVLFNTFSLAAIRIVISSALAIFFAWVVTRTDTPLKGFIEFMLWLGFFLPVLPMTMGWILLLDSHYGVLNKFLIGTLGFAGAPFNIFSYWGIIWCHLAFSTSVRFLLITPAFRNMDAALEEASHVSGSNNLGTLMRITIPILAPAILASTALGFIKSLESFELELVLGIPAGIYVLPTRIYDFIHWEPPLFGQATALSSIFLAVIFVLVWVQKALLRDRQYTTVTGRGYISRSLRLGRWRWVTFAICIGFVFVMILLPLAALIMGTFMEVFGFFDLASPWTTRHWRTSFSDPVFLRSLGNTFVLGAGAGLAGIVIYSCLSYLIIRSQIPGKKLMDFLSWLPWSLPGVLLSLALLWTVLGSGSVVKLLYGSLYLLILAMIIKEMPIGTQIFKAGIMQISKELEEASAAAGASWYFTFTRVLIPLLKPTVVAVGLIVFIAAVREVPAVIFLATKQTRTISLLMLDSIAEANMERAAVIGLFIVGLVLCLTLMVRFMRLRLSPTAEK